MSHLRGRRVLGPKPDSTQTLPCIWAWCALNLQPWVKRTSAGEVQKIPTLARPTQKVCKAGRGPVGRPPPACGGRDLLGTIKKNDTGIARTGAVILNTRELGV
ncbi:hypothetical protein AVEN_235261-1 [Araneus ventricosus]|uniref:Uncharacterized protein n=1 Tax=Araneus ventricosus TaxID=182803 RepID=A0A4Y2A333_ARAVE|nr:hypothetical protein AVEN_235261-1 [Araneus ventricosus]